MKRFRKISLGLLAICGFSLAAVALAQPVIPEMKLFFYENFLRVAYDADPNVVGTTTILEVDGNDALVNVNGGLSATGGFGARYTESFTPGEIAAVPSAITTVAGLVQSASAGQLDMLWLTNGVHLLVAQVTAQTVLPVMDSVGLDISGDQVTSESYEVCGGYLGASGRPMVVGVDPAFYFCVGTKIVDASGAEDYQVGWRSATQTFAAANTTYLNYYTIGIDEAGATTDPAPMSAMSGNDDTDVATVLTGTWADAAEKRICIFVSAAGVVTSTINGTQDASVVAYTFDDGDSLVPCVRVIVGSDLSGAIDLTEWTVGYTTAGAN